ncbi:hypothetical protein GF336_01570 [Candidatus Woesearchaeota archaeon]|nr:hypothetical protein [Candidatus Woesearchaeota archaeon]
MNPKEKEIIQHLRKGKRMNISSVAREMELPVSTVSDAIRRIESKYILKRSSLLDYGKMGYNAHSIIAVKVEPRQRKEFLDFLKKEECVNSIYRINHGFNFLFELICGDSIGMLNWIEDIKTRFGVELLNFQILKTEEKERWVP